MWLSHASMHLGCSKGGADPRPCTSERSIFGVWRWIRVWNYRPPAQSCLIICRSPARSCLMTCSTVQSSLPELLALGAAGGARSLNPRAYADFVGALEPFERRDCRSIFFPLPFLWEYQSGQVPKADLLKQAAASHKCELSVDGRPVHLRGDPVSRSRAMAT